MFSREGSPNPWHLYRDYVEIFLNFAIIMNNPYFNIQIKENEQYENGLFYLKNEFSCNQFIKETLAEKEVSKKATSVTCHSIHHSIMDHFYK